MSEKREVELRAYEIGTFEKRKDFMDMLMDIEYIDSLNVRKTPTGLLKDFTTFVKFGHPYEIAQKDPEDFLKELFKMLDMYVFKYMHYLKDKRSLDEYLNRIGLGRIGRYEFRWFYQENHEKKSIDFEQEL